MPDGTRRQSGQRQCDDPSDQIIDKHRGKSGDLIHVLMEIQHENHWLPRDVLHRVAEALDIPFSRVLRIATLYKTFSLTPKGRHEVHVCTGISCHLRGAKQAAGGGASA